MMQRGYTMLEVLITSTVMVLLVLAAYPTLNTASRRQEQVANIGMLETCVVQGIAAAKAPTQAETTTIHITFTQTPIGCTITEVDAEDNRSVTATYQIANPSKYALRLDPEVLNKEYIISVRPPYQFIVPSAGNQPLTVELTTNELPVTTNTTTFNLITGTIQSRTL